MENDRLPLGHWKQDFMTDGEASQLPPRQNYPMRQDLERAAPKIQAGVDWFYFELLPGIEKEDR